MNGSTEIVRFLWENGADVQAKANAGKTPIAAAEENGNLQIVELLKKHEAKE